MKPATIKLIFNRKPVYILSPSILICLILICLIWTFSLILSYISLGNRLRSLNSHISGFKFDITELSDRELAELKTNEVKAPKKTKDLMATVNRTEEGRLILEFMKAKALRLNNNYSMLLSELGLTAKPKTSEKILNPMDFKDIFYKTQSSIMEEAAKSNLVISDKSFGFKAYETELPKKEELDALYFQLYFCKEVILLMARTNMKELKKIKMINQRDIKTKSKGEALFKETTFKFEVECFTSSLVNFLLDLNKLDGLFLVNDLKVEAKQDGSKLILVDMDLSVFEPVMLSSDIQQSQGIKKSSLDSKAVSIYDILFKRDIFNRFEYIEEVAPFGMAKEIKIVQESLPSYRGFIEFPDGTLIGQVNVQNRTYFVGKGEKFLNYVVEAISKETIELRNLKDSKSLLLKYKLQE